MPKLSKLFMVSVMVCLAVNAINLNNVLASNIYTPIPKTGQTTPYEPGDDGDLQKGITWPDPRFTDNGDGTVSDNLTGLVWLKDANRFGKNTWFNALIYSNNLSDDGIYLIDGSIPGDWRLPNVRELHSLIDYGQFDPALPIGHPFINVQSYPGSDWDLYWSSTTAEGDNLFAWQVRMDWGSIYSHGRKTDSFYYVWPVRDENPIPIPTTMLLFGSGLIGIAGFRRRFRKRYGVVGLIALTVLVIPHSQAFGAFNDGPSLAGSYPLTTSPLPPLSNVAYYPFNGNANDASGNGNHGTVHGATLTNDRFGNPNSAYSFDGIDDYITISNDFSGFDDFTKTAWVNIDPSGAHSQIIQTSNGGMFYTPDQNKIEIEIHYDRNGGASSHVATRSWYLFTNDNIESTWVHMAFVGFSDNTAAFYINGEKVSLGIMNVDGGVSGDYNFGIIGASIRDHESQRMRYFTGAIDEVRIYRQALSQSEIQELYNSVPIPPAVWLLGSGLLCLAGLRKKFRK